MARGARARGRIQSVGHYVRVGGGRRVGPSSSEEPGAPEGRAKTPGIGRAAMAQRLTIYIPLPRLVAGTGGRTQSPFTTVVISAPTGSIVRAYGQPGRSLSRRRRRAFAPARYLPRNRMWRSSTARGSGGSGYEPTGDSQPVRAPVVIVPPPVAPPRPVIPPNAPPAIPPVAATPPAGGRAGSQVHVPNSIVAGAPPEMRGPAPTAAPARTGAGPVEIPRHQGRISAVSAHRQGVPTWPLSRCRGS